MGKVLQKKIKNPISSINSGCILIIPLNMVFGIHYYFKCFRWSVPHKKHLKTPFLLFLSMSHIFKCKNLFCVNSPLMGWINCSVDWTYSKLKSVSVRIWVTWPRPLAVTESKSSPSSAAQLQWPSDPRWGLEHQSQPHLKQRRNSGYLFPCPYVHVYLCECLCTCDIWVG